MNEEVEVTELNCNIIAKFLVPIRNRSLSLSLKKDEFFPELSRSITRLDLIGDSLFIRKIIYTCINILNNNLSHFCRSLSFFFSLSPGECVRERRRSVSYRNQKFLFTEFSL